MIDSGQAALNARVTPNKVPQAVLDRIATLREKLTTANRQANDFQTMGRLDDANKSAAQHNN